MDERYPIGETFSVSVAVLRHERREAGYPMWSAAIATRGGEATVHIPATTPACSRRGSAGGRALRSGAKLPAAATSTSS
jgi:hypothetical protein